MNRQQPPMPPGRALGGCAVIVACLVVPFVVAALPQTWPMRISTFMVTAALCLCVGALALHEIVPGTDTDGEPPTAAPGHDDPVHRVTYERRHEGCQITTPHEPHVHHWVCDMPYKTYGANGAPIYKTAPMTGSQPCRGVRPESSR